MNGGEQLPRGIVTGFVIFPEVDLPGRKIGEAIRLPSGNIVPVQEGAPFQHRHHWFTGTNIRQLGDKLLDRMAPRILAEKKPQGL